MYKPIECLESRVLLSVAASFAVTAGGTGKDRGNDVATDAAGNVYMAGVYNGPVDCDPSAAQAILPGTGSDDAFVAKYTAAGQIIWARAITGAGTQEIQSVAVDAAGNVYATGYFDATVDFDPGAAVHSLASRGSEDGFLLKLTSAGAFAWVRQLGGAGQDGGVSVATDKSGWVYVQGMFNSTADFGLSAGAARLSPTGGFDDFIVKINSAGSLAFAVKLGGTGNEFANGIVVDAGGNIFTTGTFTGTADFNPGTAIASLTSTGSTDVFVSKLSSTGAYVFAKRLGGGGLDSAGDIRVDAAGFIYVSGQFAGTADFDPGAASYLLSSAGGSYDGFVVKLNSAGGLSWARRIGGTLSDEAADLAVDSAGNVYLTGNFAGTVDFDPGAGVANLASVNKTEDAYVAKLSAAGAFVWAVALGGASSVDEGQGIVIAPAGGVYVTGAFSGTIDFDPGPGSKIHTAPSSLADAFVLRLS